MFRVLCNANKAWVAEKDKLTQGSVGVRVALEFDEAWDELQKFCLFRAYNTDKAVPITSDDEVQIPVQVLLTPGVHLFIGVYGTDLNGTIVIPTVYADLGMINEGSLLDNADNTDVPDEALSARILALANAAREYAAIAVSGAGAESLTFSLSPEGHLLETRSGVSDSPVDLGPVSAYAEVKKIYPATTMTEKEFVDLMLINESTNAEVLAVSGKAEQALADASQALNSASSASAAATEAKSTAESASSAVGGKQAKYMTPPTQITLESGRTSWSKTFDAVTASNLVLAYPDPTDDTSFSTWSASNVRCSGQSSKTLTFKADTATSATIKVNVVVFPN